MRDGYALDLGLHFRCYNAVLVREVRPLIQGIKTRCNRDDLDILFRDPQP